MSTIYLTGRAISKMYVKVESFKAEISFSTSSMFEKGNWKWFILSFVFNKKSMGEIIQIKTQNFDIEIMSTM